MSQNTLDHSTDSAVSLNPFPGLRPFEFDESHLFFGRDGQSERLIAKLAATRFLAVVGTSGSGKSSLVRAGLLPALYSGFMSSAGAAWRIAVMRPGNDPLGNLARALNGDDAFGSADEENRALQIAITEATLRRSKMGLIEAAREQLLPATENLLVVADQFEELFRVEQGGKDSDRENDRAAFVKLLLEPGKRFREIRDNEAKGKRSSEKTEQALRKEPNIYVVLTMRSDYLGDCAQFWDLPEAINDGQYLIPRLTREQIREAITGPIFVGGAEATPRLINRLLNDVGDNPDQLPILQHALMRVWDERREMRLKVNVDNQERWHREVHQGEALDLCCYEAVGTMANALSLHADEAFDELPDDRHLVVAERVFKALTEKGPDNREIRRPITVGALCLIADATEAEVKQVIETFRKPGRSFLMPPVGTELKAESLIDISHESLMRNCQRIKNWVEDEAKSARIYRRLAETAALHLENRAGLWRDPDLQLALDWQADTQPNQHWAERYDTGYEAAIAFLEKSAAQRAADVAAAEQQQRAEAERTKRELVAAQALAEAERQSAEAEKLRAEEQAQAASRLRRRAWFAGALALLACLAAWFAYTSYRRAEGERTAANEQRDQAQRSRAEADTQKGNALNAKAEAEAQKEKAEQAAKDAEAQKKKAEAKQREAEAAQLAEALQRKLVAQKNNDLEDSKMKLDTILSELEGRNQQLQASLTQSGSLLYVARGLLAQAAMDQQDYIRANGFLEDSIPAPGTPVKDDLRNFDWFYRWRQLHDEKATLKGHTSSVDSITFSPDGRTLASGGWDDTIKLWDVASGQEKATLKNDGGSVKSLSFSPDGKTVASAGSRVKLWDARTGQAIQTLDATGFVMTSISFSPDGKTLTGIGSNGRVDLWDAQTRQVRGGFARRQDYRVVSTFLTGISPDGKILVSEAQFKSNWLVLWNLQTSEEITTLKWRDDSHFISATFSPDGKTLASACSDGSIVLWDVGTWQERQTLKSHASSVKPLRFSPDGKILANGNQDGTITLWDTKNWQELWTLKGHTGSVLSLSFSPEGTLASGSADGTVKFWNTQRKPAFQLLNGGKDASFTLVSFSPEGKIFASGKSNNKGTIWSAQIGQELQTFKVLPGNVEEVSFSPDGKTFASLSDNKIVKLWDRQTGEILRTIDRQQEVRSVSFSANGKTLASGEKGNTVKLWDVQDGTELRTIPTNQVDGVWSVHLSPDGKTLASMDMHKSVKLWDIQTGRERRVFNGDTLTILTCEFSPDGKTLAISYGNNTVKLWDVQSGQLFQTLSGHTRYVESIAYSPDGKIIATGSRDKLTKLWDVLTGQELMTFPGDVQSISFSPDGKVLAIADGSSTIRLYLGATDAEVARQCNRCGRKE